MTLVTIWDRPTWISSGKGQFVVNERYRNRVNSRLPRRERTRRNRLVSALSARSSEWRRGRCGV